MRKTYEIKVYRDGRWWMIEIPAIDGLTQARRLAEVKGMAASFIAVDQDIPLSDVAVDLVALQVADVDVLEATDRVSLLRSEAQRAEEKAAEVMRKTAWRLTEEGVPVRDIGLVLGVSYQRVSQLVNQ